MSTDFNKLMLTHYTDNTIHITPAEKHTIEQAITSVTDNVTLIQADYGEVGFLLSEIITSGTVIADFVDAEKVATNKLLAAAIEATFLYAQHAELEMLNVVSLFANYATIENLTAYRAEIEILLADFIRADQAVIGSLTVDEVFANVAEIFELLSFQITSEGVSSIKVTSEQLVVSDGFITDAMILDLVADKIKTGTIYTNLVNIQSESGNLLISDNTIQIKDSASTLRVQVGKDANADYNMYVWDVSGNLMFDATGIHADGIKQPIIRNDMVSETANISGSKLNIDSVVTEINDGTRTLKSSKILFDETGQTLDVSFKTLSELTDGLNSEVTAQGTTINVLQGQITNKVWQTDINTSISPLNTKITTLTNNYSTLDQTVGSITATVTSHTSNISTLEDGLTAMDTKVTEAEQAAKAHADTKASEAEQAAKAYAEAKAEAERVLAEAYANGKVTAEEQARINDVNAKLATAKSHAETKADEAEQASKAYTDALEVGGRNLIIQSTITRGAYLNKEGSVVNGSGWFFTDYIPVDTYTQMITSGYTKLGISPATVYYDGNKNFIKGINNDGQSKAKEIIIDSGVAYIRFSGLLLDLPTLKLEKGNTATDWTPAPEDIDEDIKNLNTRVNTAEQKITPEAIVSTVKSNLKGNDVASIINQTATTIKLQASKIKLEGLVTANSRFKILTDGSIEATDGKFTGDIISATITGGTITGGTIDGTDIHARTLHVDQELWMYDNYSDLQKIMWFSSGDRPNPLHISAGDSAAAIIVESFLSVEGLQVSASAEVMGRFHAYGGSTLQGITRIGSGGVFPLRLSSSSSSTEEIAIPFYKSDGTSRKGFVGFIETNKQSLYIYSDEGNIILYNSQNQVQIGGGAHHLYFPGGRKTSYLTGVNCNSLLDEWVLGSGTNFPTSTNYYVHTILYDSNAQRLQLAYSYQGTNLAYMRHLRSGAWSAWTALHT